MLYFNSTNGLFKLLTTKVVKIIKNKSDSVNIINITLVINDF